MNNKNLGRLWLLLVFVAFFSGAYLLLPPRPKVDKPTANSLTTNQNWSAVTTNTTITSNQKNNQKNRQQKIPQTIKPIANTNTASAEPKTATDTEIYPINAIIEISGEKYLVNLPEKSTVYDALMKLQTDKKISVKMKEFSGLGYFVEEINGLKNDNQANKYWIYYINDQTAKIGISSYILKNNDLITWKYEDEKF